MRPRLLLIGVLTSFGTGLGAQVPAGYKAPLPDRDTAFDVARPAAGRTPRIPLDQPALHRLAPKGVDCRAWTNDSVTPSGDRIHEETAVESPAKFLEQGAREYPPNLESLGRGGRVAFRFVVDTLGRPEPCSFSTLELTDPAFEGAAFRMALGSRYRPATQGGRPVPVLVSQSIVFNP